LKILTGGKIPLAYRQGVTRFDRGCVHYSV